MANKLLGLNGKPLPDPNKTPPPFSQWLYHQNHEARIFTSQAEVDAAIKEGWVDTPAKLKNGEKKPVQDKSAEISVLEKKIELLNDELNESFESFAEQAQRLESAEKTIADLKNVNADLERQLAEAKKGKK